MKRKQLAGALTCAALVFSLWGCVQGQETITPPQVDTADQTDGIQWNDYFLSGTGTGGARRDGADPLVLEHVSGLYQNKHQEYEENGVSVHVSSIELTALKNTVMQNRVNETIQKRVDELASEPAYTPLIQRARELQAELRGQNPDVYVRPIISIYCSASACGDVLSVVISRNAMLNVEGMEGGYQYNESRHSPPACYNYDMRDGSPLRLTDLFYDDVNVPGLLNPMMVERLRPPEGEAGRVKQRFAALPREYPYFFLKGSCLVLALPEDNPYVEGPFIISLPLEGFYQDAAFLGNSARDHLLSSVSVTLYAPPTVPAELETAPLLPFRGTITQSPRIASGVEPQVRELINAELVRQDAELVSGAALPQALRPALEGEASAVYRIDTVQTGPLLSLTYSVRVGVGQEPVVLRRMTFDLRTGDRLRLRDVLAPSQLEAALALPDGQGPGADGLDSLEVSVASDLTISLLAPVPVTLTSEFFDRDLLD